MADPLDKYKELFCSEAEDRLRELSETLLQIEKTPEDRELYSTLMRSAHTIKGAAATMGYTEMSKLAHALEDLFHAGERAVITLGPGEISVAFAALDQVGRSLAAIKDTNKELSSAEYISQILSALHAGEEKPKTETAQVKQAVIPAKGLASEFPYAVPTAVRVGVERLDALMGLFEEMLMLRLKLDTILEPALSITKTLNDPALKQKFYFLNEFKTLFASLARLLSETQEELLRIRLVPLDQIFGQFPRMVRDLALREEKKVDFHVEGGEVLLDRTVLEGLGGALAHLLRNAIDHGIVKEGTVTLSAKRVNDRVHVAVEDNGAGVAHDRVRKVAVERGVVTEEAAAKLRNVEIAELLFHANMSTNETVTDISGRGVGLFAVRAFAQDVGGRVSVISPTNDKGGTRFLVDLPISLATIKVLLVHSSGFTFAVPFAAVKRTLTFRRSGVVHSAHQETTVIDGRPISVVHLDQLLGITFAGMFKGEEKKKEDVVAVLLSVEGEEVVLAVDECAGEQELLVKSLPPILRDINGFSGSTLLPDGRTVLLLDAHGLLLRVFDDILKNTHTDGAAKDPIA